MNFKGISCLIATTALLLIFGQNVGAEDWTRFRGTGGAGVSSKAAPVNWSPDKNIKWKTELPGAGVSCPIIVGDKIPQGKQDPWFKFAPCGFASLRPEMTQQRGRF